MAYLPPRGLGPSFSKAARVEREEEEARRNPPPLVGREGDTCADDT